MSVFAIVTLSVFILAWVGAASSWAVAAYSVMRVWTDGSFALATRHRSRTLKAAGLSATFIVTALLAGAANGHLHI